MPEIVKLGLKLFVISAVAALALAVTNEVTKGPIAEQQKAEANAARFAVLAEASDFNAAESVPDGIDEIFYAVDANGETIGYTGKITVKGYGGNIEVTVGMKKDGTLGGVNVGGSDFSETAGLGARTKDPEFTDQFHGFDASDPTQIYVTKDGGKVDAVSSATVSSRAVTGGIRTVCEALLALGE